MLARHRWPALVALIALVTGAAIAHAAVVERGRILGTGATADLPPGASAVVRDSLSPHVWWVTSKDGQARFLHTSSQSNRSSSAPLFHEVLRVADTPDAITANDDRVWAAFPPSTARPHSRDVLTFATRRNPATGIAFADPPSGQLLASLPASGDLVGFSCDSKGPWALFQGSPSTRFGVRRESARSEPVPNRLFRLVADEWVSIDMPSGFETATSIRLANIGGRIALVAPTERASSGGAAARARVARLGEDGWRATTLEIPPTGLTWMHAAGRPAVAWTDGGHLRIAYVRDGAGDDPDELALLPWATLALPASPWLLAGDDAGAVLITAGDPPSIRRLGPLDVQAGPLRQLAKPGFSSGAWIHLPLLAGIILAALIAYAISRSVSEEGAADAREAPRALSLDRRALALFLDLVPSAIVTMLVLDVGVRELLVLPAWTLNGDASEPAVLAILIACLHGGILEAFVGASIGKLLVGARVVGIDGSRLPLSRTVVRGILKFVTLCAPILIVFVLLNQARRSVGDSLARAIVVVARPPAAEPSRGAQGESPSDE